MNCNHRCYECHIPACPDRIRQSIGPRIIPMFADPPEWSADKVYSPLTLVIHNGATFMSRRCVPANTALPTTDPFYNESWVMVYDMNAQVAQYREEVAQLSQQVTDFSGKVDSWEQMIVEWTALISNWSSQFPEFTKDLAAITERVATLETEMNQAQQDISALQATQQTHTEQIAANTQAIADLTPRVQAAEEHLTELDAEQQNQDERLNNIDNGQNLQNTQIKALQDADATNKENISANSAQIAENAEAIAANAAEIAKHAERLEALETSQGEQDSKIQANADAIAQHTIDIGQAKAAAQQAQDTATHAGSAAQAAQELAQQAKNAADAAAGDLSGVTDRVEALETSQGTQDGKISALETSQGTQDGKISALETAQTQTAQDIADLKDGSTELPYVKKVNGSATGTLAVENLTVSGTTTVKTPVNGTDAASKQYVDQAVQNATGGITPDVTQLKSDVEALQQSQSTQDGKITALETAQTEQDNRLDNLESGSTALPYLKKSGDSMTGVLYMTNNLIKNVKWPVDSHDAINKAYADDIIKRLINGSTALPYVKKSGDTMTGALNLPAPTENANAANKKYVDDAVQNATDPELAAKVEELKTSQGTQDGKISALETAQTEQESRLDNLESGSTALPYLKKTGDTGTGTFNFTGANLSVKTPTADANPVTKKYVDDFNADITAQIEELRQKVDNEIANLRKQLEAYENPSSTFTEIHTSNYSSGSEQETLFENIASMNAAILAADNIVKTQASQYSYKFKLLDVKPYSSSSSFVYLAKNPPIGSPTSLSTLYVLERYDSPDGWRLKKYARGNITRTS